MKDHIAPILEELRKAREELKTLCAENAKLIAERDEMKKWHDAVLHECMMTEACYVESNPLQSVKNLVGWHVEAEREAMMKQEPYGYVNPKDECNLRNKGYAQIQTKITDYSTMPLFRSPLPHKWYVKLTNQDQ